MTDLEAVFDDNAIYYIEKNNWLRFNCPFCDDEKMHAGYNINSGAINCFRCGKHKLWQTVSKLLHIHISEAKKICNKYKLYSNSEIDSDTSKIKKENKPILALPKGEKVLSQRHKLYLERRGFDYEKIQKEFDIYSSHHLSLLAQRIIIPIKYEYDNVSWTSRTILKDADIPRYISCDDKSEIVPHKDILYNYDNAKENIIVVEGPIGVWRIGNGAVATFGIQYTNNQFKLMLKKKKIYILFDPEPLARKVASDLVEKLQLFGKKAKMYEGNKDIDELSNKQIKKLKEMAL